MGSVAVGLMWLRMARVAERVGPVPANGADISAFAAAMDDDLGTPSALAAVHEQVRAGNTALADGDHAGARAAATAVPAEPPTSRPSSRASRRTVRSDSPSGIRSIRSGSDVS